MRRKMIKRTGFQITALEIRLSRGCPENRDTPNLELMMCNSLCGLKFTPHASLEVECYKDNDG